MRKLHTVRLMLLALFVCLVPALSFGEVFISVNFAPPMLPVYEQPPCPEEGLMWTPGYWAYDYDIGDYYWVPGTWVPAPYEGALWTPGYWGWDNGLYVWYPGYWGDHVGYYGGVNYGFGYMGIGFVGGMWRGHDFLYNTEVMRVNDRFIHHTYRDRDALRRYTIDNERHVAYSGGPGGINHRPAPEERMAERDRHVGETSFQTQHMHWAVQDRGSFSRNNGGHPGNAAVERPMNGRPDDRQYNRDGPDNRGSAPMGGDRNDRQAPAPNQRDNNPGNGRDNRYNGGNIQAPPGYGSGTRNGTGGAQNNVRQAPDTRPQQPVLQQPVQPRQTPQPQRAAPQPTPPQPPSGDEGRGRGGQGYQGGQRNPGQNAGQPAPQPQPQPRPQPQPQPRSTPQPQPQPRPMPESRPAPPSPPPAAAQPKPAPTPAPAPGGRPAQRDGKKDK